MPQCPSPLHGWRGPKGTTFDKKKAYLDQPVTIPCGKCDICQSKAARDLGVRAYFESLDHEQTCMLTLTFDDNHLPEQVTKDELRQFVSDVSEAYGRDKEYRYIGSGEYGDEARTARPHYHLIIFGNDFMGGHGVHHVGDTYHINETVSETWGKGQVQCNTVDTGALFYVAGYVSKKYGDERGFVDWTKRPGLGFNAAERHLSDLKKGTITIDGTHHPIPQSFRLKWPEVNDAIKALNKRRERELIERDPDAWLNRHWNNQNKVKNLRHEMKLQSERGKAKGIMRNEQRRIQARRATLGLTKDHFRGTSNGNGRKK